MLVWEDTTTQRRLSQSLTKSELADRLRTQHCTLSLAHDLHLHGLAAVRHHTDTTTITLTTRRSLLPATDSKLALKTLRFCSKQSEIIIRCFSHSGAVSYAKQYKKQATTKQKLTNSQQRTQSVPLQSCVTANSLNT